MLTTLEEPDVPIDEQLFTAAQDNELEELNRLLSEGATPNGYRSIVSPNSPPLCHVFGDVGNAALNALSAVSADRKSVV